jgi:dienelactone hydrolase
MSSAMDSTELRMALVGPEPRSELFCREVSMARVAAALALCLAPVSVSLAQPNVVALSIPPAGIERSDIQWAQVAIPDLGKLTLAIARPVGRGPFPTVIVLHGTHGFAREYMEIASALARKGMLAIAACWFAGGGGEGAGFVEPIAACPDAPAMSAAASATTFATVDALARAARTLPDVKMDALALFGHSRGGGAALNYVLKRGQVAAVILESIGYTDDHVDLIPPVTASFLILHGAGDTTADGGSPFQTPDRARRFEAALRDAGKQVRAVYYEGAGHNGIFSNAEQFEAVIAETASLVMQPGHDR